MLTNGLDNISFIHSCHNTEKNKTQVSRKTFYVGPVNLFGVGWFVEEVRGTMQRCDPCVAAELRPRSVKMYPSA